MLLIKAVLPLKQIWSPPPSFQNFKNTWTSKKWLWLPRTWSRRRPRTRSPACPRTSSQRWWSTPLRPPRPTPRARTLTRQHKIPGARFFFISFFDLFLRVELYVQRFMVTFISIPPHYSATLPPRTPSPSTKNHYHKCIVNSELKFLDTAVRKFIRQFFTIFFYLKMKMIARKLFYKIITQIIVNLSNLSCVPWFPGHTWRFVCLQKGTWSLETRLQMTNLIDSKI